MNGLTHRERELVSLGAAIACNCVSCVEFHIPEARRAGLSDTQIKEAVQLADQVRRVPARLVLDTSLAKLEEVPGAAYPSRRTGCDCAGS